MTLLIAIAACAGTKLMLDKGKDTADLQVHIEKIAHTNGRLRIAVFGTPDGFPSDITKAERIDSLDITGASMDWVAKDLPTGIWAVAVLHDEDGNGEMATGWMGAPSEGWGVSNDARGHFGPPSFEDAAIELGAGGLSIVIHLGY